MTADRFRDRLDAGWAASRYVCVGLDPDPAAIAARMGGADMAADVVRFNTAIIDATWDLVLAYKPNAAFYEQLGPAGMAALQETIGYIHVVAPRALVILDAKRGDIEHTNAAYATALFDVFHADAVTVQPYLGGAALAPFLSRADRGVIILCRTSNPGAGELQDLTVRGRPLYQYVAEQAAGPWNRNGNCGLLVGATYPDELARVRRLAPRLPLLLAGVGAQRGPVAAAVDAGLTGGGGIIVSASRSVCYAGSGPDFAAEARSATAALHDLVAARVRAPAPAPAPARAGAGPGGASR